MGNKNSSRWPRTAIELPADDTLLAYQWFFLALGRWPTARVRGWATSMLSAAGEQRRLRAAWQTHQAAIAEDTRRYGFAPCGLTGVIPHGRGVTRWQSAFLKGHTY